MTPRELFSASLSRPQWIHGNDIGVDERNGLWVRAAAKLNPDLGSRVQSLGNRVTAQQSREYSILTADRKTGLDPRHRAEPVWGFVHALESGSIGPEWIAVD